MSRSVGQPEPLIYAVPCLIAPPAVIDSEYMTPANIRIIIRNRAEYVRRQLTGIYRDIAHTRDKLIIIKRTFEISEATRDY